MSDVERKITQRVLGMLDEMNGPNGASMNHFWWNAVHPEFSEDFAYFDSIGQFHLGESELRKAFDVRGWSPQFLTPACSGLTSFYYSKSRTSPPRSHFEPQGYAERASRPSHARV